MRLAGSWRNAPIGDVEVPLPAVLGLPRRRRGHRQRVVVGAIHPLRFSLDDLRRARTSRWFPVVTITLVVSGEVFCFLLLGARVVTCTAPSFQTAITGVTWGLPSARTVDSQEMAACERTRTRHDPSRWRSGVRSAVGGIELDGRFGVTSRHARYRPPPTSELIAACSTRAAVALPPRRVDGRKVVAVGAIAGRSIDQLADDVGVSGVATRFRR